MKKVVALLFLLVLSACQLGGQAQPQDGGLTGIGGYSEEGFNALSDQELAETVFSGLTVPVTHEFQRNDSEILGLLTASREACDLFPQLQEVLDSATIQDGWVLLDGQNLTHEKLESLVDIMYRQAGFDMDPPSFIVVAGAGKSYDHSRSATGPIRSDGFITIDVFAKHANGFWADNARTFTVGNLSVEERELFSAVVKGYGYVGGEYVPGGTGSGVATGILDYFSSLGYNTTRYEGLRHNPGHGLSAKGHDRPAISRLLDDELMQRQVVTIEVGLYYQGIGGAKLETAGVITSEGFVPFCDFPLDSQGLSAS